MRLSFWGGIDQQHLLPNGTMENIEAFISARFKDAAY